MMGKREKERAKERAKESEDEKNVGKVTHSRNRIVWKDGGGGGTDSLHVTVV